MRKLVDQRNLYDSSEAEQDIVSGVESKNKHFKAVEALINQEDIHKLEALRLVMLFALRYENDDKDKKLREILKNKHNI
jgi:vacuolar protein sorting-associated protein 45